MIQNVVVLGDLVAVSHVYEEFDGDLWVVNDEVWQLCWAHVNVKDHLLIRLERFAQLLGLVWLERCLASSIQVLLHLRVVELFRRHIEIPVWFWQHARDQEHRL